MKYPRGASLVGVLIAAVVVIGGAMWQVLPQFRSFTLQTQTTKPSGTGPDQTGTPDPLATQGPDSGKKATGGAVPPGLSCPGNNGGATDLGVTGTQINLASTLAESGEGSSFLGDARYGLLSVVAAVNRSGGICGRRLNLKVVDDGWNASTGEQFIRSFIADHYFALAVVPSSEGLNQASLPPYGSNDIDRAGIPVVGTDGMLYSQYVDSLIWPVATSTISTSHIAVLNAYNHGARSFGIVWDRKYKFGGEGEAAFKGAVSRLSGATLAADVGIEPGQQDYGGDVQSFNNTC